MAENDDHAERLAVIETKHEALEARVGKMEGNQRWVVLSVIGSIIVAAMTQLGLGK